MSVLIYLDFFVRATPPAPTVPLTHARIGYDNIVRTATLTASSEVAGRPASSLKIPFTYEKWQPASLPATITLDAGELVAVDYLGIAAHTLKSNGNAVKLEYLDQMQSPPVWTEILEFSPDSDDSLMALFDEVQARQWRLTFTAGTPPEIAVIYLGKALAMERAIYGGHAPLTLNANTTIRPTKSVTGQTLGRSIIRRGFRTGYNWRHLTPSFVRDEFMPFVEAAKLRPFFIAWRPETFPDEVGFAWTKEDIAPVNMGLQALMEVSMQVEAYDSQT